MALKAEAKIECYNEILAEVETKEENTDNASNCDAEAICETENNI
jgi:hypothetical protein